MLERLLALSLVAPIGVVWRIGSRRKDFFFEKKKQKTFVCFCFGFTGWAQLK
jgi:hypothetical protein